MRIIGPRCDDLPKFYRNICIQNSCHFAIESLYIRTHIFVLLSCTIYFVLLVLCKWRYIRPLVSMYAYIVMCTLLFCCSTASEILEIKKDKYNTFVLEQS